LQVRRSKKGNKFAFCEFSDHSGQFELLVFGDVLESHEELLRGSDALLIHAAADIEGESPRLRLVSARPLDEAARGRIRKLRLRINGREALEPLAAMLREGGRGELEIILELSGMDREVHLQLAGGIDSSPRSLSRLRSLPGIAGLEEI